MSKAFEVRWDGEIAGTPQQVWDAITLHADGWLWKTEYEPRVGGTVSGLGEGTVTAWDPPRHLAQRAPDGDGFNQIETRLEPTANGTSVRYVHQGVLPEDDYDRQLDACRQHTAFYQHSLGEYVAHFAGREAVRVSADGPESSAEGGLARIRAALGLTDDVVVGDHVRLTPAGLEPIYGVVDYATSDFLGIRTTDALYRVYGRDSWAWPVEVAHHYFGEDVDQAATQQAWTSWLNDVFAKETVA